APARAATRTAPCSSTGRRSRRARSRARRAASAPRRPPRPRRAGRGSYGRTFRASCLPQSAAGFPRAWTSNIRRIECFFGVHSGKWATEMGRRLAPIVERVEPEPDPRRWSSRERVLGVLQRFGPVSRAEIAEHAALSRATVSAVVAELRDAGLAVETDDQA